MGPDRAAVVAPDADASPDARAVMTRGLVKSYGRRPALRGLDLEVRRGEVFGYLGPNGAGKSTTIRLLAGLLRPTSGTMRVLGLDPTRDRTALQRRIGYLPGAFTAYGDLTVDRLLAHLAALRGGVDETVLDRLVTRLGLDVRPRIDALSHGNRQKVGLVQALMHEPELVLLDEPTTGLDPLVQVEFGHIVRELRDAGRTVLLSSHVLSEVAELADTVGILRAGRLVTARPVDELRGSARRRLDLSFATDVPVPVLEAAAGVTEVTTTDHTAHVVVLGSTAPLLRAAAPHEVVDVVSHETDLGDVFLRYYREQPEEAHG